MRSIKSVLLIGLLTLSYTVFADPVGSAFTYQGELRQLGQAANGSYDFKFDLYDVEVDGAALAGPVQLEDVNVQDGVFTVELDFGSAPFSGAQLWLEIGVRDGLSVGDFSTLSPRQIITASPYAVKALSVTLGSITSDHIDPTSVQKRVDGTCETGSAMRVISSTGGVTCQAVGNWAKAGGGQGWLNGAASTGSYFFPGWYPGSAWTAPISGVCAVTMTARTYVSSASGTFNVRTAREVNGSSGNDGSDTHYGVQSVSSNWYVGTVTHTWSITAGNSYRFGCWVDADDSYAGNNFWCRVSYVCTQ